MLESEEGRRLRLESVAAPGSGTGDWRNSGRDPQAGPWKAARRASSMQLSYHSEARVEVVETTARMSIAAFSKVAAGMMTRADRFLLHYRQHQVRSHRPSAGGGPASESP